MDGLENATLYAPSDSATIRPLVKAKNLLSGLTVRARGIPSGLQHTTLTQDYSLLFYSVAQLRDLNFLSSLRGWRRRSACAICWLQELWIDSLDRQRALVARLNEFDFVICSFAETAEVLQDILSVPVLYLPWGVDMLQFCPYPNPPRRAIDMLSVGIKHEVTHKALIDYADQNGQYYSYETISGRAEMQNYREHRYNYIGQLQRTRYFFSYIAKVERTLERGQQVEFGLRYLEGLASGAVILGNRIDSDAFKTWLDWPDSVIDIPYACPDIGSILSDLDAQPARLEVIRTRNILECLERHDHLYRWEKVLALAGMEAHPKLAQRRGALQQLIRNIKQAKPKIVAAI
ncbi:hypothetical protein [Pseudohalocynthiibacter sp. F2068]|uniref:hypothetical protein n=1 Tax=Pseudohalocynthiibacter sp. F2068 TaxID=2926418 RepID=UPI001FF0F3CD|nr:hypothetical protein [Pseudohalocynthiibacter sp. F2068]MCK0103885.1 hypothetical protein [Pseudohalocynthiibacter sp. F2068]